MTIGYHGNGTVRHSGNEFFLGDIFYSELVDPKEHFGTYENLLWGGGVR